MLRSSTLALVAVLSIGSAAMAQQDEADFQPGPQNNPDSCSQLWQGIGLPERNINEIIDTQKRVGGIRPNATPVTLSLIHI